MLLTQQSEIKELWLVSWFKVQVSSRNIHRERHARHQLRLNRTARNLNELKRGEAGIIDRLDLPHEDATRLMEMGLLVGTTVELVRFAPLGDPVEIKVRGYHLTLRKHEAEQILVHANA